MGGFQNTAQVLCFQGRISAFTHFPGNLKLGFGFRFLGFAFPFLANERNGFGRLYEGAGGSRGGGLPEFVRMSFLYMPHQVIFPPKVLLAELARKFSGASVNDQMPSYIFSGEKFSITTGTFKFFIIFIFNCSTPRVNF